jgi:subfamily B ATP-binding cassette protein MsbA
LSDPVPSTPPARTESLLEFEQKREQFRKQLRWWHLFVPASGDDVRAYRDLFAFVRPYKRKLLISISLAAISALFLGAEIAVLQEGLSTIFEAPTQTEAVAAAPGAAAPGTEAPAPRETISLKAAAKRQPSWFEGLRAGAREKVLGWTGIVRPRGADEEKAFRHKLLWLLAVLLVVAISLASLAKYGHAVLMSGVSRRIVRDVRAHLFRHLMSLSVRFHQKNHSAQLVSRITNDLEVFGRFLTEAMVRFLQDLLEFLAMLAFIAVNQGSFIFVVAGVIAAAIAPVNAIGRRLRRGDTQSQAGMGEVATVISEAIVGHRVVKAFVGEEHEYGRFRQVARKHMKKQMRVRRLRSMTEPIVMIIGGMGIAAIVVVGGYAVLDGRLDAPSLVVNIAALARAMGGLRGMSKQLNDFQMGLTAADRVGVVLKVKSDIAEKPGAPPLPRFAREIRFEGVHFRHEPEKPTLHGIDLVIRKGERVALVGPSGAGKTTFVDLVPRFFDVDAGRITIDGHDVRDVTLRSLRQQIGIVSQETVLFRDSIRDNIAYGRPGATKEEIAAAAKAANAHDFIRRKPKGYRTRIGERGTQLSGGERQRLAIARALLRDPPILILDEATSALDSHSEAVVQAALKRLMVGRTVILIAHRLSTVRGADRIVALADGRIAESGTHDELMAIPGGLYRKLHDLQAGGADPTADGASASAS